MKRLFIDKHWLQIKNNDKILHMANTSFDAASFEIWMALLTGATLCIYKEDKVDIESLTKFLEEYRVTIAVFTAKLFSILAEEHLEAKKINLHCVMSCGDVMNVKQSQKFQSHLPDCILINAYGPAENGIMSTYFKVPKNIQFSSTPIGKPVDGTEIILVDEHLSPVKNQEIGEICLPGTGLSNGYWKRPEMSATAFITGPKGKRMYRSADLGRMLPDGNIEFCGRKDSQVKIRGFRIEPIEKSISRPFHHLFKRNFQMEESPKQI